MVAPSDCKLYICLTENECAVHTDQAPIIVDWFRCMRLIQMIESLVNCVCPQWMVGFFAMYLLTTSWTTPLVTTCYFRFLFVRLKICGGFFFFVCSFHFVQHFNICYFRSIKLSNLLQLNNWNIHDDLMCNYYYFLITALHLILLFKLFSRLFLFFFAYTIARHCSMIDSHASIYSSATQLLWNV